MTLDLAGADYDVEVTTLPSPPVHAATESALSRLVGYALPHLPDVLAVHEPNGHYRLLSPRSRDVTGWRPSELMGHSPYDWIHPDDVATCQRKYHEAMLRGVSVQGRLRFRHRLGHYVWLDFTGVPLFDDPQDARKVSGFVTFSREVTPLIEAEQAARERSNHLLLMQDLAGLAWFTHDFKTGDVRHNEAFVELTGQAASSFSSRLAFRRLVAPPDRVWLRQALRDLRHGLSGDSRTLEVRLVSAGRGLRWVRMSLALLEGGGAGSGHQRLLYGAMLDIDELVRSREQTRRWVRERELASSRERLEIAHELHDEVGQILTGLRWQLEAAQRAQTVRAPAAPPPALPLADWMVSLDEAHTTLRQIAQRLRPPLAALGLRAAIHKLAEEFVQRWLGPTQLELLVAPDLPDGDEWRVNLVLGMLRESLNNVARHARATRVTVQATAPLPGLLRLTVVDDGVGMDLGAPQVAETLGLTSLRERARLIEGRFTLDSAPGCGTRIALDAWITGEPHGTR